MKLRQRYFTYALAVIVSIAALALVTYALPKVIERLMLLEWGRHARPAVLTFGDALGCVILGLYWGRKRAVILYAALTAVDFAVFSQSLFRFGELLYFEDLIPSLIIISYALVFAVRLRPDPAAVRAA